MRDVNKPGSTFVPNPLWELYVSRHEGEFLGRKMDSPTIHCVLGFTVDFVTENMPLSDLRERVLSLEMLFDLIELGFLQQVPAGGFTFVEVPQWLQVWYNRRSETKWPDHKTGLQQETFEGVGCEAL